MITIGRERASYDIDIGAGAKLRVRPCTTPVYKAARLRALRQANDVAQAKGLLEAVGATIYDIPDQKDREAMIGLQETFMLQALAVHAVESWDGVVDEAGVRAPVTPAAIEDLVLNYPMASERFEVRYLRHIAETEAEGEGSGSAPSGISAAGPTVASDAETPTAHAPVEGELTEDSAPTESINPLP